jgi:branched-chain amino acid transport system permease protein
MKKVPSELWCVTSTEYTSPNPNIHLHFDSSLEIFGVKLSVIISLILVAIILNATYSVGVKSQFRDSFRTNAENSSIASNKGYFGSNFRMIVWFLAGGFAALSGSLLAFRHKGFLGTRLFYLVPSVLAGSFLGGLDSLFGALFGGLIIGFLDVAIQGLVARFIGLRIEYIRILFLSSLMLLALIFRAKWKKNMHPQY